MADYTQELIEDATEIPPHLVNYIDYEAMGGVLLNGDLWTIETRFDQVHIFWNR